MWGKYAVPDVDADTPRDILDFDGAETTRYLERAEEDAFLDSEVMSIEDRLANMAKATHVESGDWTDDHFNEYTDRAETWYERFDEENGMKAIDRTVEIAEEAEEIGVLSVEGIEAAEEVSAMAEMMSMTINLGVDILDGKAEAMLIYELFSQGFNGFRLLWDEDYLNNHTDEGWIGHTMHVLGLLGPEKPPSRHYTKADYTPAKYGAWKHDKRGRVMGHTPDKVITKLPYYRSSEFQQQHDRSGYKKKGWQFHIPRYPVRSGKKKKT